MFLRTLNLLKENLNESKSWTYQHSLTYMFVCPQAILKFISSKRMPQALLQMTQS